MSHCIIRLIQCIVVEHNPNYFKNAIFSDCWNILKCHVAKQPQKWVRFNNCSYCSIGVVVDHFSVPFHLWYTTYKHRFSWACSVNRKSTKMFNSKVLFGLIVLASICASSEAFGENQNWNRTMNINQFSCGNNYIIIYNLLCCYNSYVQLTEF